jgi:hypothetical protein
LNIGEGKKVEAVWAPSETATDNEGIALVAKKIENGIPPRQALLEAGYTQEQVDEWMPVDEVNGLAMPLTPDMVVQLAEALRKPKNLGRRWRRTWQGRHHRRPAPLLASSDFFRAVADLRRMLAADSGDPAAALERLAIPALEHAAKEGARRAHELGGQRAVNDADAAPHVENNAVEDARMRLAPGPARHITDPLDGLDARLADAKARAVALLRSGTAAETALAPVFGAAANARLRVTTQINASSNEAALTVGDAVRSPMVWEAERDACVFCLALAGQVVTTPGDPFPRADLYAEPPASQWTVSRPPLHGHCRCRLAVLVAPEYADALKREAQRSVLRGLSLSSESQAVRVRAAQRLLERDPVAPKSVKAYAAKAVKEGRFPNRQVPAGDPRLKIG